MGCILPPAVLREWLLEGLDRLAGATGDPPPLVLRKRLFVVAVLAAVLSTLPWSAYNFLTGRWIMGTLILTHDLLGAGAILLLGPRRRFGLLVNAELALLLAFSLAFHVVLGGFVTSAGIILWAFLAPLAALLMLDARASWRWFLAFLAVVAAAALIDPRLGPVEPPTTASVPTLSFAFNLLVPILLAYLSLRLVFGEREQALQALEVEREVTERERATLEAIMGSMSEGLVVCDSQGRIRYASSRMPVLMPADPSAGPVRHVEDWLAGVAAAVETSEDLEKLRAALLSAEGQPVTIELQASRPGRRDLLAHVFSPLDRQGEPLGRCLLLRDVTAQRQVARAQLEAERSATITELARRVAHELLNPLGAVVNMAFLLRGRLEERAPPEAARLRSLERDAMRISRLVRDLLAYAEPPRPRWEEVDLAALAREALAELDVPGGIDVVSLTDSMPPVVSDADYLKQALRALVINAIEAMPQGGRVTIRARADGGQAVLEVEDAGPGIPPEVRERIFDALYTTKVAGGFGLGLAAARNIVAALRGTIEVISAPGKGATFAIRLPVGRPAAKG